MEPRTSEFQVHHPNHWARLASLNGLACTVMGQCFGCTLILCRLKIANTLVFLARLHTWWNIVVCAWWWSQCESMAAEPPFKATLSYSPLNCAARIHALPPKFCFAREQSRWLSYGVLWTQRCKLNFVTSQTQDATSHTTMCTNLKSHLLYSLQKCRVRHRKCNYNRISIGVNAWCKFVTGDVVCNVKWNVALCVLTFKSHIFPVWFFLCHLVESFITVKCVQFLMCLIIFNF